MSAESNAIENRYPNFFYGVLTVACILALCVILVGVLDCCLALRNTLGDDLERAEPPEPK